MWSVRSYKSLERAVVENDSINKNWKYSFLYSSEMELCYPKPRPPGNSLGRVFWSVIDIKCPNGEMSWGHRSFGTLWPCPCVSSFVCSWCILYNKTVILNMYFPVSHPSKLSKPRGHGNPWICRQLVRSMNSKESSSLWIMSDMRGALSEAISLTCESAPILFSC